jgi:hypothetical protein
MKVVQRNLRHRRAICADDVLESTSYRIIFKGWLSERHTISADQSFAMASKAISSDRFHQMKPSS